jgi:hypothetical protein
MKAQQHIKKYRRRDIALFVLWIVCTGLAGYFHGSLTTSQADVVKCVDLITSIDTAILAEESCEHSFENHAHIWDSTDTLWHIKQARFEEASTNVLHHIKSVDLSRTKWSSVVSIEPRAFFSKYLTQYPGDMEISEPVVVFSQKHISTIDDIATECKLFDVVILPDSSGKCVSISETTADIASLHMLHATVGKNEKLISVENPVDGRVLPTEHTYHKARALLLDYFDRSQGVISAFQQVFPFSNTAKPNKKRPSKLASIQPHHDRKTIYIGCLILNNEEIQLFKNSLLSLTRLKFSEKNIVVITPEQHIKVALKELKMSNIIYIPKVKELSDNDISPAHFRSFLQIWVAFTAAELGYSMLWQSPGTVWLSHPSNVLGLTGPHTELLWAYKGREDKRASPFFVSFDFLWIEASDNPIHLVHEILLRVDLIIEWNSLDAVTSYRLSENNAR